MSDRSKFGKTGLLHLVFLGLVTFYILSYFLETGILSLQVAISKLAAIYFTAAVIFNETVLLVDGVGRLFQTTNPIYDRLLWIASIGLFSGAILLIIARMKSKAIDPETTGKSNRFAHARTDIKR